MRLKGNKGILFVLRSGFYELEINGEYIFLCVSPQIIYICLKIMVGEGCWGVREREILIRKSCNKDAKRKVTMDAEGEYKIGFSTGLT